jgi:type IV fimbrial biogenesis protein FimT
MKGFTVLEWLLAMGIAVVLLLVAVPSYHHLLARNQTTSVVDRLITAVRTARNEAVAENQVVVFCGSSDSVHCDGQWQAGQIMRLAQNSQVLHTYPGVPAGDRLWWQSSLGYNDALKLAPTGFTQGQRGSFYYCPQHEAAQYGAKIIVSDSARLRVETDSEDTKCESYY